MSRVAVKLVGGTTLAPPVPYRNYVAQARLGVTEQEHEAFFREMLGDIDEPTLPYGLQRLAAVGTAGLRIASNASEVVAAIEARTGIHIDVISGEEEGRLAYVAAKAGLGLNKGSLVVFDTGGGSSQFSFGHDGHVDERFSVDVGAVRFTERFGLDRAVSPEVLREAMAAISADLSRIDGRPVPDTLVAMGVLEPLQAQSFLALLPGLNGLTRRVPQAEGLALDNAGNLYVVSERNLFFAFQREVSAP